MILVYGEGIVDERAVFHPDIYGKRRLDLAHGFDWTGDAADWWDQLNGALVLLVGPIHMMAYDNEWGVKTTELEYYEPRVHRVGGVRSNLVTFVGVPAGDSEERLVYVARLAPCEDHGWYSGTSGCPWCQEEELEALEAEAGALDAESTL